MVNPINLASFVSAFSNLTTGEPLAFPSRIVEDISDVSPVKKKSDAITIFLPLYIIFSI